LTGLTWLPGLTEIEKVNRRDISDLEIDKYHSLTFSAKCSVNQLTNQPPEASGQPINQSTNQLVNQSTIQRTINNRILNISTYYVYKLHSYRSA